MIEIRALSWGVAVAGIDASALISISTGPSKNGSSLGQQLPLAVLEPLTRSRARGRADRMRSTRSSQLLAIFFMLLAILALHLYFFFASFNTSVYMPPRLQAGQFRVAQLSFELQASASDTADAYGSFERSFWNPSIIWHNDGHGEGQYLVATRASTRSLCGGVLGTIWGVYLLATRPAYNTIFVGSVKSLSWPITQVDLSVRLPNKVLPLDGTFHYGFEDPRWVSHGGRLFLLTTRELDNNPAMFLTPITPSFEFGPSVQLASPSAGPQKNWMHVPHGAPGHAKLLFAYSLDPLRLLWVDPESGDTVFVNASSHATQSATPLFGHSLSGSSNFISSRGVARGPGERAVYVGLAHSRRTFSSFYDGTILINEYVAHFVRLSVTEIGEWRVQLSEPVTFPVDGTLYTRRINFPTTLAETPTHFIISLGEMDCSSHIMSVQKGAIVDAFNQLADTPAISAQMASEMAGPSGTTMQ